MAVIYSNEQLDTAGQVSSVGERQVHSPWESINARLAQLETRQERIEELLEEIVDKLNDLSRDYGPGYAVEG